MNPKRFTVLKNKEIKEKEKEKKRLGMLGTKESI